MNKIIVLLCILCTHLSYSMDLKKRKRDTSEDWFDCYSPYSRDTPLESLINTAHPGKINDNNNKKVNVTSNSQNVTYSLKCFHDGCKYLSSDTKKGHLTEIVLKHIYNIHKGKYEKDMKNVMELYRKENYFPAQCLEKKCKKIKADSEKELEKKVILHFFCTKKHNKTMYDRLKKSITALTTK